MKADSRRSAFALVIALSLMAFVLLLLLSISTIVQVESRSSSISARQLESRQAALLSINMALGKLQGYAGHDQRVTASADVLFENSAAGLGRANWVGVWDTSEYDPSRPEDKEFMQWLVSSPTSTDDIDTSDVDEVSNTASGDYAIVFQGVDDASTVVVPKVKIENDSMESTYYAYWVADEGVKANLRWNEGIFDDDERTQAARLAASPGVDYGVFNGPFTGITYPIELGGSNTWLDDVTKATMATDMSAVTGVSIDSDEWMRANRHDMTLGSFGLMTDVKNGGLRTDLSIAFEMDGDADFASTSAFDSRNGSNFRNAPNKFSAQTGVFVSDGPSTTDPLAGKQAVAGVTARYVYGDTKSAGNFFSADIPYSDSIIRGPTWFAMRDYANAYKRLTAAGGDYAIVSRASYPNTNTSSSNYHSTMPIIGTVSPDYTWDEYVQVGTNSRYLAKPYEVNYAPVLLGYTALLSVMRDDLDDTDVLNDRLALGIDPIFFLWNPYNCNLTADRFLVSMRAALPGRINIWKDGAELGVQDVQDYIGRSANYGNLSQGSWLSYSIRNVDLAPGEVKIYTPPVDKSLVSANSRHPYNTDAFEGADLSSGSGALITKFPVDGGWNEILLSSFRTLKVAYGMPTSNDGNYMQTCLQNPSSTNASLKSSSNHGPVLSALGPSFAYTSSTAQIDGFEPAQGIASRTFDNAIGTYSSRTLSTKQFCGVFSMLMAPANFSGAQATPVENFAQFNPLAQCLHGLAGERVASYNQEVVVLNDDFSIDFDGALQAAGVTLPSTNLVNGYWGSSYSGDGSGVGGSTVVPAIDVPRSPIYSLAHFAHANLGVMGSDPLYAVGNSFASPFVSPVSPYGALAENMGSITNTAADTSWLLNDALFDSYYLSGIAPDFSISSGGYSASNTIEDTLETFYGVSGSDYREAQVSPVLRPYIPDSVTAEEVVEQLDPEQDGLNPERATTCYQKLGAYTMIDGAFNVNSTSIAAWTALLRGNRGLDVSFSDGSKDTSSNQTPMPRGTSPVKSGQSENYWSELSRLSDDQIDDLAAEIVKQVKLRGPFMSLSDFVNHRVGTPKNDDTHYLGALQAAIEDSGINSAVSSGAGGVNFDYSSGALSRFFSDPISGNRRTTTGIYTDITQADLLMPLAPRLAARSDTFCIRGYGEVRSIDGSTITAQSVCEAVVQRVPEYVDTDTNPSDNEAWDSDLSALNSNNQQFGRRFKIVKFRWLNQDEI